MNKIAEIELRRTANILIYFANSTEFFGKTKANKLLYYLDCFHLLRYGRTVLRDKYKKCKLGPVPIETYNRLAVVQELSCMSENDRKEFGSDHELMFEYIEIITEKINPDITLERIVPKKDFEPIWFSESEREIMEELAKEFYSTTAAELVRKTHKESPYKEAKMDDFIDLKLFLKDHNMPQNEITHIAHIEKIIDAMSTNYQ